jgi:hypothetical protein
VLTFYNSSLLVLIAYNQYNWLSSSHWFNFTPMSIFFYCSPTLSTTAIWCHYFWVVPMFNHSLVMSQLAVPLSSSYPNNGCVTFILFCSSGVQTLAETKTISSKFISCCFELHDLVLKTSANRVEKDYMRLDENQYLMTVLRQTEEHHIQFSTDLTIISSTTFTLFFLRICHQTD